MRFINFYENELHKFCSSIPYLQTPSYMGKAMIAKLGDDLRVKISFAKYGVHKQYETLRVQIINRSEGEVDSQIFKFSDLLTRGRTLAISDFGDGPTWGLQAPLQSDYIKIAAALHNYIAMYAPAMEQESGMGMTEQSM